MNNTPHMQNPGIKAVSPKWGQVNITEAKPSQTGGRALIFPARIAPIKGKPVYYLFSIRQVAEVLYRIDAHPVPFAPRYAQGVAQWRGRVLPVLSLEHCLGIEPLDRRFPTQSIVLRSVTQDGTNPPKELYAVCSVGIRVHQLDFPLNCEPLAVSEKIADVSNICGVYEMQERVLMVLNIDKILNATNGKETTCTKNPY